MFVLGSKEDESEDSRRLCSIEHKAPPVSRKRGLLLLLILIGIVPIFARNTTGVVVSTLAPKQIKASPFFISKARLKFQDIDLLLLSCLVNGRLP